MLAYNSYFMFSVSFMLKPSSDTFQKYKNIKLRLNHNGKYSFECDLRARHITNERQNKELILHDYILLH